MARRHASWLLGELPQLEREGVIDAAAAARLRERYRDEAQDGGLARGLSAIVGTLLVGLGIILLIAHNWDQWPRALRLAAAALPLLLGQLACVFALKRRADSAAWRESAAVFTLLAFAAALALVGQILQLPGDLDRYLLSCALAGLPLVYLLNASLVAVLVAGAFAGWVGAQAEWARQALAVLAAFALLLPQVWRVWRRQAPSLHAQLLLGSVLPLMLLSLTLATPAVQVFGWGWLAACIALLLLIDAELEALRDGGGRPLRRFGELGWAVVALSASFPAFWRERFWWYETAPLTPEAGFVGAALALSVAVLSVRALRRHDILLLVMALPIVVIGALHSSALREYATLIVALVNLYVLGIGIAMIRRGVRERGLGTVSAGLTLLAALVLLRFFGTEWPFVVRGAAFVIVGAGFLFANLWLRRRWQQERAQ